MTDSTIYEGMSCRRKKCGGTMKSKTGYLYLYCSNEDCNEMIRFVPIQTYIKRPRHWRFKRHFKASEKLFAKGWEGPNKGKATAKGFEGFIPPIQKYSMLLIRRR